MQISRLFEIVYLLMERGSVTARELSGRFEVSVRTIYRDIDVLSGAGIPVYASKGRGGGIHLMDDFCLSRSLLSEQEQGEILASLQGLRAIQAAEVGPVLTKLAALFGKSRASWLDVDFTGWGGGEAERSKFSLLKSAVLNSRLLSFDYFNSMGEATARTVEPLKILFKGQGWYLYAFCRVKQDFRMFKITRIKNPVLLEEKFSRSIPDTVVRETDCAFCGPTAHISMWVDASLAYRVYDEFAQSCVQKQEDGSFIVTLDFPQGDWMYGYLLSFGGGLKVLEPPAVRREMLRRLEDAALRYKEGQEHKPARKLNG